MTINKILLSLITTVFLAACTIQPATPGAPSPEVPAAVVPATALAPAATVVAPAATVESEPTVVAAPAAGNWEPGHLVPVAGEYSFTEGPAVDPAGNVYFSDLETGRIYRWSAVDGQVSIYWQGLNAPNGLAFDPAGNLVVCEGGNGRLIAISPAGQLTVLVSEYNGLRLNEPNDLWVDALGGIYFTDPAFQSPVVQPGEYVYYLSPDRSRVVPIITDLVRPNGIVGAADGRTLWVADYGANRVYAYEVGVDGAVSNRRLAIDSGSDGMDLDAAGNLYLTTGNEIRVYSPAGQLLVAIPVAERPTNLAFAGTDLQTLFVTAQTAVYTLPWPGGAAQPGATEGSPSSVGGSGLVVTSSQVEDAGRLPVDYTCDGRQITLPLAWSGAPTGTQSYAVIMHHVASATDIHWYWVLYNIPADVTRLAAGVTGVGTLGTNSVNDRTVYAGRCSKGPGDKEYIYTVYALSAAPVLTVPPTEVTREVLLRAMEPITLASAELHVIYARPQ